MFWKFRLVKLWFRFDFFRTKNIFLFLLHLIVWLKVMNFDRKLFHDLWRHCYLRTHFKSFFIIFYHYLFNFRTNNLIEIYLNIFESCLWWFSNKTTKINLNIFWNMIELLKWEENIFNFGFSMSSNIELFVIHYHIYLLLKENFINKLTSIQYLCSNCQLFQYRFIAFLTCI